MTRRLVLTIAAIAAAATGPSSLAQNQGTASLPSRAAAVAEMLVEADGHAAMPTRTRSRALGRALTTLDRLGVRAAPGSGDDAIAEWRELAAPSVTPLFRGRLLGPAFRRGWLDAGQVIRVEQLFVSGQVATVSVASNPTAPLQLGISGPGEAVPCRNGGRECNWMPLFTQRYTITLSNRGGQRARFYLVVD